MSEDVLLSWLQAGNVPTTDQEKNDKFFIFTCATLEASETLPLAELEREKRNIVVEASANLSLKSDCEAFRDEYQRIYEMDEYTVQALRKYTRRYNWDSLKLIHRLIPRSQFYVPLADRWRTSHDSLEGSIEALCAHIKCHLEQPAQPFRSGCLRVLTLAQTTIEQSVRDFAHLNSTYFRLARLMTGNPTPTADWDHEE
ncbi:hypothetical protein THAOC_23399 [Thalassiosira oceanica]|uniref:Uncharacterized protein n=1 Tax=Thalassiosira oceanica TaxID=159749 RepID=K0RSA3_THAOC|nr:hypothetical protein THAOC_23399 [Thalassiosira oceanica]|eukprot:EJK56673.1 hypothetical protein THAOC_23399 [Thalassiosira oceanica]